MAVVFSLSDSLEVLERTPWVLSEFLDGLSDRWVYSNEGEHTWSPFDVIGHLIHGELTDWMPRLRIILEHGESKEFESFDRFAQFRNSEGKSMRDLLKEFRTLREHNIVQLKEVNLQPYHMKLTGRHPYFGSVTVVNLLSAWVVHDLTHISQVVRTMAKQYDPEVGPFKEYLGILNMGKK